MKVYTVLSLLVVATPALAAPRRKRVFKVLHPDEMERIETHARDRDLERRFLKKDKQPQNENMSMSMPAPTAYPTDNPTATWTKKPKSTASPTLLTPEPTDSPTTQIPTSNPTATETKKPKKTPSPTDQPEDATTPSPQQTTTSAPSSLAPAAQEDAVGTAMPTDPMGSTTMAPSSPPMRQIEEPATEDVAETSSPPTDGQDTIPPTPSPVAPAPATDAPVTDAPVTDAPATDAPVSPAPSPPPSTAEPVEDVPEVPALAVTPLQEDKASPSGATVLGTTLAALSAACVVALIFS